MSAEIVDVETEKEILYQAVCDQVSAGLLHAQGVISAEGVDAIAGMAVTAVLRALRVMSGRQMAVLLAQEANRHARHVIHEPPRYSAAEIGDAT